MIELPKIEKKTKLIILSIVTLLAIAGVYYYQRTTALKVENPVYLLEVKTEKEAYARGEQIKFVVTNKGTKPVWYLVPPEKCKSDFHWNVLTEVDRIWNIGYKYPKCEVTEVDKGLFEIKTLDPNASMNGMWDQKLSLENIESRYAEPGRYKITFYYSNEVISKSDIKKESDLSAKSTQSLEFAIGKDFYDDSARAEVQKGNDSERKNDLAEIKKTLEAYYQASGQKYPESGGLIKLTQTDSEIYKILSGYINTEFLSDPNQPEFFYGYSSDGSNFELSARLENLEDENCEIFGESLCLYKIDSQGKVSGRKHRAAEVLTVERSSDFFMEKLKIVDGDKKNTIIVTSDIIGNSEKSILEIGGTSLADGIQIKKASEVSEEDLGLYNLVLSGSPESNSIIEKIEKKTALVDVIEGIDIEKNRIKIVVKFAKNPWNNEKIVLILGTDYSMGSNLLEKGTIEIEKRGDFDHAVFKSDSGKTYALVISSDGSGFYVENLSEFKGKYVEIRGYERIRDSEKFPVEDAIGVLDARILE